MWRYSHAASPIPATLFTFFRGNVLYLQQEDIKHRMKDLVISRETTERALLVGLVTPRQGEAKVNEYLDELDFLAQTAGAEVVGRFTQKDRKSVV